MPDGTGGWSLSDLNSFAGIGALFVTLGGVLHVRGRKDAAADAAKEKAEEAKRHAEAIATDLAAFKLAAAEKFVPRMELSAMESRLSDRIDGLGTRVEASVSKLGERIDRIAEK
ncbi:hypothetical protein GJ654_18935 [Rhodoblastus acidophilus]|uniref:Uncharacterized protein n=1 Tax=Rhodoblastus acidophilus TaxID=1074 RepID=A0A6N8DR63_RHOAC|nr:hypothetical protein [Rhodoblastus acidophilus]MCW2276404.1 hypothetical protein [Rhodoblastus acidophilus]MTV33060.1 hypothetical protein [Rhodoblastus acidophilus]